MRGRMQVVNDSGRQCLEYQARKSISINRKQEMPSYQGFHKGVVVADEAE